MLGELTPRQTTVLNAISTHIEKYGYPPTRQELAELIGAVSGNAAQCHLEALVKKGWVSLKPGKGRGIALTEAAKGEYSEKGESCPYRDYSRQELIEEVELLKDQIRTLGKKAALNV